MFDTVKTVSTSTVNLLAMDIEAAGFSDPQWWAMCDAHMSLPVPLHEADLTKPFIYDRRWGVFYVPSGHHQLAMSLLLAFHHNEVRGMRVAEKLGLRFSEGTADWWLEKIPGTAFRSSVGKRVQAGAKGNLTVIERRLLGEVQYLG